MYFYIMPTLFPAAKKDEETDAAAEDLPPVEPTPWWWTITKWAFWAVLMGVCFLLMIYFKQEGMLFVPSAPIQYIEQNPPNYLSPTVRGLEFEELKIKTEDNLNLQGWFLYKDDYKDKDTVVFLHENAGNIGLRLDYFQLMCHQVGVNVVCFAYRGYSRSEG